MSYGSQRLGFAYSLTPWVKRLLVANTAIFLLSVLVGQGFFFEWFGFSPRNAFTRPWGAVTYMFLHADGWHLLMNMLVLFFFGPPLESRWGSNEFIKYFVICGLGGVALSFVFASGSSIIGASAATYGLMLAFALYWPDTPIYVWGIFPVKAILLVMIFFALSFISGFGGEGGGVAHFAHMGGVLAGLAYIKLGDRLTARFGEARGSRPSERFAIVPREPSRAAADSRASTGRNLLRSRKREEELLDEVDRILDKISARGIGALTDEERKVLDEVSKKRRSN
jgi:membrane associated rhomboid family serine protease